MTTSGVIQTKFVKWLALSLRNNHSQYDSSKAVSVSEAAFFIYSFLIRNEQNSPHSNTE